MSVNTFFFVRDAKLPTLAEWQVALNLADTGIVLEDVGDLRKHTGYLPAMHRGHHSGFEWYYGPLEEHFDVDSPEGLDGREHVISCVTHSDMRELACGLAACAVLAQMADGKFYDEDTSCLVDPAAAMDEAKSAEEHIKPQRH
jgi:hypothetical protein